MKYNQENAGAAALAFARELTGYPYVYGGTWPQSGGTDCDGLWSWAYAQCGISVQRPTYAGYLQNAWDSRNGHAADPNEPGDLLWIPGADPQGSAPGHVMGFVEDGVVFQAEQTGTLIGQYPADTTQWAFRTRPALQLAALLPPPLPKSIAAVCGAKYRPIGNFPLLTPGADNPREWVIYLRRLGRTMGFWPAAWPLALPVTTAGYGTKTQDLTIRIKRHFDITPINAGCGSQVWTALGVTNAA